MSMFAKDAIGEYFVDNMFIEIDICYILKKVHEILSNIKIVSIFAPANQIYTF